MATPITLPQAFRSRLLIDTGTGEPRPLSQVAEPRQLKDFMACDPGWLRAAGMTTAKGPQRVYLERARGGSKTTDLAVMAAWILLASPRKLSGVAAAADKDQGRLLIDAIETLCRLNPWLGKILDVQSSRVINKSSGSSLDVISADVGSSYGLTPHFLLVDELTHWPGDGLWVSLFSSIAKRSDSMLCIISNAGVGQGESWQWKIREAARASSEWYFHSWDTPAAWITPEALAEQERILPRIAFERLFLNRWTAGQGDALSADAIEAAITLPGQVAIPEPGWAYYLGCDLGISRDCTALCVVGRDVGRVVENPKPKRIKSPLAAALEDSMYGRFDDEGQPWYTPPADDEPDDTWVPGTGRIKLVTTLVFRPVGGRKIDLTEIERCIKNLHHTFRFSAAAIDPYQAELLQQRIVRAGLPAYGVPFTAENLRGMASCVLDAFNQHPRIELYRDETLVSDLKALRVKETANGTSFRLYSVRGESQGTTHGDLATALSLALLAAKRAEHSAAPVANFGQPLLCWP